MDGKTFELLREDYIDPVKNLLSRASGMCNQAELDQRDLQNLLSLAFDRLHRLAEFVYEHCELSNQDAVEREIRLPCYGIVLRCRKEAWSVHYPTESGENAEEYNAMMHVITSTILAHAAAGIDVETPAYIEGIETAVETCSDRLL